MSKSSSSAGGGGEKKPAEGDSGGSSQKESKLQTFAERLRLILFEVQPELAEPDLNDWLQKEDVPQMPNAVVFANGRFQGLVPKIDAEHGVGGHPGLIFRLMMVALLLGTDNIAISYSTKEDDDKNPLSPESKARMIRTLIPTLKEQIVALLIKNEFNPTEVREKLDALDIKLFPLTNLFSTVAAVGKSFPGQKNLVMVTGLEKDKQGNDYNKYATTFKNLSGFTGVDFVLNSRQSQYTISGTEIREAVLKNYYDELGRYLLDAGFTNEAILKEYGKLIHEMKTKLSEPSQTELEYAETLQTYMIFAALEKLDRLKELEIKAQKVGLDEIESQELDHLQEIESSLRTFAVLEEDPGAASATASAGGGFYEEEEGEEGGEEERGGKRRKQKTRKQKLKKSRKARKTKTKTRKIKSRRTRGKNKNKNKK